MQIAELETGWGRSLASERTRRKAGTHQLAQGWELVFLRANCEHFVVFKSGLAANIWFGFF